LNLDTYSRLVKGIDLSLWYGCWSTKGIIWKELVDVEVNVHDVNISIKDLRVNNCWCWDNVSIVATDWLKDEVQSLFLNSDIPDDNRGLPTNLFRTNKHIASDDNRF